MLKMFQLNTVLDADEKSTFRSFLVESINITSFI